MGVMLNYKTKGKYGPESYKLTMEVISEPVKTLGPAIITAILGYKSGQAQLKIKLEELNKNKGNSFSLPGPSSMGNLKKVFLVNVFFQGGKKAHVGKVN